ncbi:MAG: asparagine synthase (glutamine-hydrolyzing) [Phycisphaerales bacterium]|nr:asparagine synthase (glutamine-hydrolyzing) [Phycisphaerales bacterium]
MCGIAGILTPRWSHQQRQDACLSLASLLAHRGPDDQGCYCPPSQPVGLCHRRLSIIDVSSAGHQPMTSSSGRWVMVFNGEIYNAGVLRPDSEPASGYRGHSDSEVLCELVDRYGPREAALRANGMFAFAAWDVHEQRLHLVRDRVGIKPLFLCRSGSRVAFASEVSALQSLPDMVGSICRSGLSKYLRHGYFPGSSTIYANVVKVDPGTHVVVQATDTGVEISSEKWWDARCVANSEASCGSLEEAVLMTRDIVADSVRARLVSDRPIGAFLSGGVDSSLVVAEMVSAASEQVRTFSIGFEDSAYDESPAARVISRELGTLHTERILSERDLVAAVPQMAKMFGEPFADSSQIPTHLLCALARDQVVVGLSGDGGDELFCGYDRYFWAIRSWRVLSRIPLVLRRAMSSGMRPVPQSLASLLARAANGVLPKRLRVSKPADKYQRVCALLGARDLRDLYERMTSCWYQPESVLSGSFCHELESESDPSLGGDAVEPNAQQMMLDDLLDYLPNDILVKVDRASMSKGLEVRVPLLDHRLVDLALAMPLEYKRHLGIAKWPLRRILSDKVQANTWAGPKQGFGVPLDKWLRGPLREWAGDLLAEDRLVRDGYFNASTVQAHWKKHLRGEDGSGPRLWCLLMFNSWLDAVA